MARMHSRKKGNAGSKRPYRTQAPEWVDYDKGEVEELVVKLAKEGQDPSTIGRLMRDQHGIPSVKLSTDRRVSRILEEKDLTKELPEDIKNLMLKAVALDKHMKSNSKDTSSKRGLQLTEAKIRRLVKYYIRTKKLPSDWKYNINTAKLLVK